PPGSIPLMTLENAAAHARSRNSRPSSTRSSPGRTRAAGNGSSGRCATPCAARGDSRPARTWLMGSDGWVRNSTMKIRRLSVLAVLFLGATRLFAAGAFATDQPRPNIVVILADDQGWGDLSVHGNTN